MRPHHGILLTELLLHLDFLAERIHALERTIEQPLVQLPAFQLEVARLETITGVSRLTAVAILAETGVDMSRFPSAANLIAWAGLAPGNNESAGKQRSTRTRQSNRTLRTTLVQASWAAIRKKDAYLGALYHRVAARRGKKRAIIAVARTILQAAYYMVLRQVLYQDLGADYFDKLNKQRTSQRLVRRLESLGFAVNIQAALVPTPA
jgi:transposase